jgi:hypothetical protein
LKSRKRLEEHDVPIYLRLRGEDAKDVDSLVYKFCDGLKKKLGRRLVVKGVEVDK